MTGLLKPKSSEIGHFFCMYLVVYLGRGIFQIRRSFDVSPKLGFGKGLKIPKWGTSETKWGTSIVARARPWDFSSGSSFSFAPTRILVLGLVLLQLGYWDKLEASKVRNLKKKR